MKIRKGMEETYCKWLEKIRNDHDAKLMMETVHGAGEILDNGGSVDNALRMILGLNRSALSAKNWVEIALAISLLNERGDEFRFAWNKYHAGEDWALDMELSEKRLYNPA